RDQKTTRLKIHNQIARSSASCHDRSFRIDIKSQRESLGTSLVKTIWQVRRAAFVHALLTVALSAVRMTQHKQPSNQRFTQRWRSIATAALLACVFLLPAFAAQAQVNTQITVTQQSPNPSAINQQVTFVVTVTAASGSASPTGTVNLFNITSGASQIGTGTLSSVSAGVASTTINVSFNQAGSLSILASYTGAAGTFNGNQTTVTQTVGTQTTMTPASNPNPSQTG